MSIIDEVNAEIARRYGITLEQLPELGKLIRDGVQGNLELKIKGGVKWETH